MAKKKTPTIRPDAPAEAGSSTAAEPLPEPASRSEVVTAARRHGLKAVKTLADMMGNADAPPTARVSAATRLIERGYGAANARQEGRRDELLAELTDDEVDELIESLEGGGAEEEDQKKPDDDPSLAD